MTTPTDLPARASRRIVFQGLGALGVAAALAGCGGGDDGGGGAAPDAGAALAPTSEVPVGGGLILTEEGLVITQPTEGDFQASSTTCTHTGTAVNEIDGAEIVCPNHGSRFSIEDGSALNGPATEPLPTVAVRVEGDNIVAA